MFWVCNPIKTKGGRIYLSTWFSINSACNYYHGDLKFHDFVISLFNFVFTRLQNYQPFLLRVIIKFVFHVHVEFFERKIAKEEELI